MCDISILVIIVVVVYILVVVGAGCDVWVILARLLLFVGVVVVNGCIVLLVLLLLLVEEMHLGGRWGRWWRWGNRASSPPLCRRTPLVGSVIIRNVWCCKGGPVYSLALLAVAGEVVIRNVTLLLWGLGILLPTPLHVNIDIVENTLGRLIWGLLVACVDICQFLGEIRHLETLQIDDVFFVGFKPSVELGTCASAGGLHFAEVSDDHVQELTVAWGL